MPRTRYDIFLSYRRADTARVQPLRDELRRLGYFVFFDTQSIESGEDWKNRLGRSIAESRALVLCWSEQASQSAIVTFEYSSAMSQHKRVIPWMLDSTPLPVMLSQINGIPVSDPVQVAAAIQPALGQTLAARRKLQGAGAGLAAVTLGVGLWFGFKPAPPPPPWEFQGEVIYPVTRIGIAGVEVDATTDEGVKAVTKTDTEGRYGFRLPPPKSKSLHLLFRKPGYAGDEVTVPASKPFNTDLTKLR